MIQIHGVSIGEFRGIRKLTLDLKGKNFAICGPNGTGKSGIVDAIEFALTGNISRLSGAGTGGLTIKDHAPHVDSRNNPEKSYVSINIYIPSLKKSVIVTRRVSDARKPNISPNSKDISFVLNQIQSHPEFTLSRRQLIQYVLSEPGKRAKEVQALLRLEELETIRATLQKIANAEERSATTLGRSQREAIESLQRALVITQLTPTKLLEAINAKRAFLDLPLIPTLGSTTVLDGGIVTAAGASPVSRVPKVQARADIKGLEVQIEAATSNTAKICYEAARDAVAELGKDAASLDGVTRQELLESALKLFNEHACPVCDTEWEPEMFREIVGAKLKYLGEVAARRKVVEVGLEPIADQLEKLVASLNMVAKYGLLLNPPTDTKAISTYSSDLLRHAGQLRRLLPLGSTEATLGAIMITPMEAIAVLKDLTAKVSALPEPSQQEAARQFLTVAQERLVAYRSASLKLKTAQERASLAATVVEQYGILTTDALEEIYTKVQDTFKVLYRSINSDDEENFEAKLTPSMGKLGFDVDFYGRGFFPPGAYHSEGHQDGMGLCLYLALMDYLLGAQFTFAVLDDVLMSVDSGHRREVSKLLRTKFPNTQFVMTTHDDIWLRHMRSDGLVQAKGFVQFRTWDVEHGPMNWTDHHVWDDIADHINKNEVSPGAALLRRFLEHQSQEICHRLRAKVEFRGDALFMLNDLLPPAIGAMKQLIKKGKAALQSWGKSEEFLKLQAIESDFVKTVVATKAEEWQINAAVHYNTWATLDKADFTSVVAAFRDMTARFRCPDCDSLLYVVPERGPQESLRCSCNGININLVTKPKD